MEEEDKDSKYEKMEKTERKAKRELKAMHYRSQELKCCGTCKHCYLGYPEDPIECTKLSSFGNYHFGLIQYMGICDCYEAK